MQAFGIGLGDTLGLRLSAAQLLFNAAARLVEFHYGRSDARYIPYLRNIVHSAYQVARNPQLISELGNSEFRGDRAVLAAMINERLPSQPAGFIAGEEALRSIISFRQEQEDVYALAESIAELADWYLLYAQRRLLTNSICLPGNCSQMRKTQRPFSKAFLAQWSRFR